MMVTTGVVVACGLQDEVAVAVLCAYWLIGLPLGVAMAFNSDRSLDRSESSRPQHHPQNVNMNVHGTRGSLTPMGLVPMTWIWLGMIVGVLLHLLVFFLALVHADWHQIAKQASRGHSQDDDGTSGGGTGGTNTEAGNLYQLLAGSALVADDPPSSSTAATATAAVEALHDSSLPTTPGLQLDSKLQDQEVLPGGAFWNEEGTLTASQYGAV